jgi:hypothetical protein
MSCRAVQSKPSNNCGTSPHLGRAAKGQKPSALLPVLFTLNFTVGMSDTGSDIGSEQSGIASPLELEMDQQSFDASPVYEAQVPADLSAAKIDYNLTTFAAIACIEVLLCLPFQLRTTRPLRVCCGKML